MRLNQCPCCGKKLAPGRTLCKNCETRTRKNITITPQVTRILQQMENPLKSSRPTPIGSGKPGSKPPLNLTPMIAANRLQQTITEYATALNTTTRKLKNSPKIATSTASRAYAPQLDHNMRHALHIINPPEPDRPWGKCPACGHTLTAPPHAHQIICTHCSSSFDPQTLAGALATRAAGNRTGTQAQILKTLRALGLTTPESTLRNWIRASKLTPAGVTRGKTVYPLARALKLALTRSTHTMRAQKHEHTIGGDSMACKHRRKTGKSKRKVASTRIVA